MTALVTVRMRASYQGARVRAIEHGGALSVIVAAPDAGVVP